MSGLYKKAFTVNPFKIYRAVKAARPENLKNPIELLDDDSKKIALDLVRKERLKHSKEISSYKNKLKEINQKATQETAKKVGAGIGLGIAGTIGAQKGYSYLKRRNRKLKKTAALQNVLHELSGTGKALDYMNRQLLRGAPRSLKSLNPSGKTTYEKYRHAAKLYNQPQPFKGYSKEQLNKMRDELSEISRKTKEKHKVLSEIKSVLRGKDKKPSLQKKLTLQSVYA